MVEINLEYVNVYDATLYPDIPSIVAKQVKAGITLMVQSWETKQSVTKSCMTIKYAGDDYCVCLMKV